MRERSLTWKKNPLNWCWRY